MVLGFINVMLALLLGPFLEGLTRKYVKAQIAHSRRGPLVGPLQPFYDLLKLLGKEDLEVGGGWQRVAPVLCLTAVLAAAWLTPMGAEAPLSHAGDAIVLVYVLGLSSIALLLGGFASQTSYAFVGSMREVMLYLVVEPVLAVGLIAGMVNAQSLRLEDIIAWHRAHGPSLSMLVAAFALFLALWAQFGKLPFDIPEAEQEIIGGPFIEMSGPKLALFQWALWARQFVLASLWVSVFFPWLGVGWPVVDFMLFLAKVALVFVLVGLVEVVTPRLRIDQALRFYLATFFIAGMAVALAYVAA
jgi:formate hydrogenlyase subunit 4